MKELTQKILEAGLVEKNTVLLMEKWGQVDRGSSELVGTQQLQATTEAALTKFAEEIEDLIEREREEVRESRLVFQVGAPMLAEWVSSPGIESVGLGSSIVLFLDNMNNFIFPLREDELIKAGAVFRTTDKVEHTILEYQILYVGPKAYAIQVRV